MTQITIPDVATSVSYSVVTSQTGPFTVPFPFFEETDVQATVTDANGVITNLVHATDFIFATKSAPLSQEGNGYTGGTIVLNSAIGADGATTLKIFRSIPIARTANYPNTGLFDMSLLNDEQNKHIAIMQEIEESVDDTLARAVRAPLADTAPDMELPIAAQRADMQLLFDSVGNVTTGILAATAVTREIIGDFVWPRSALEIAAGLTPSDTAWPYGHVMRWGAVADSAPSSQGTDNTTAFQNAIDSGHPVYVPEGYYSIEGTLEFISAGGNLGGKTFIMNSEARLERFSNNTAPLLHIIGVQNYIDCQGGQIAARSFGGFDRGLVLVGQDPDAATAADSSMQATNNNFIGNMKIIGDQNITGWDGSVGFYMESAARRRGSFIGNTNYRNNIFNVYSTQWDYCFHLSTDVNANAFTGCHAFSFGNAAWNIAGALNTFSGCTAEGTPARDTTERYAWNFPIHNVGPDAASGNLTNEDAPIEANITGVTTGNPTTITAVAHGFSNGTKILIEAVVDNGPDGDLEDALNYGVFEVTSTGADTFTIPIDTTGLTNTYVSGGTIKDSIYPALTGKANLINGWTETLFNAANAVVRLMGFQIPKGAYNSPHQFEPTYGLNVLNITGSHTGGIGPNGSSVEASIGNNIVRTNALHKNIGTKIGQHDFWFRRQDDSTGSTFGTDQFKMISGRIANIAASQTLDLFTIDNVGANGAGVIIKLSFCGKEQSGEDIEGGEISWLCPVSGGVNQTPVKYKDFQANYNTGPLFTFAVIGAAGTDTNTGQFTLRVTTAAAAGDYYMTWKAELVSSNLEGSNLDWDDDLTITN